MDDRMDEQAVSLPALVVEEMTKRGLMLATGESSGGGLIAHLLAQVPGASRMLAGGIVAYANDAKKHMLGADPTEIEQHGAVSESTALAMAEGARLAFNANVALAESGIASPPESDFPGNDRPTGLYYIACVAEGYARVERHVFPGTRVETMHAAADAALRLVLDYLDHLDSIEGVAEEG
jgi:PncC family amidohydrolase